MGPNVAPLVGEAKRPLAAMCPRKRVLSLTSYPSVGEPYTQRRRRRSMASDCPSGPGSLRQRARHAEGGGGAGVKQAEKEGRGRSDGGGGGGGLSRPAMGEAMKAAIGMASSRQSSPWTTAPLRPQHHIRGTGLSCSPAIANCDVKTLKRGPHGDIATRPAAKQARCHGGNLGVSKDESKTQ